MLIRKFVSQCFNFQHRLYHQSSPSLRLFRHISTRHAPVYSTPATKCVQSGEAGGRVRMNDCLITPICQTSTYTFRDTDHQISSTKNQENQFSNPTADVLAEKIRALEHGEDCLLSSSGMSSSTTMLMALLPPNGHLITTKDCYRRTRQFVQDFLPQMGVTYSVIDMDLPMKEIAKQFRKEKPDIFFSESPTNPYLRCVDIDQLSSICRETGTILCIDSTFATPINQQPLTCGADLVLHSGTKYLAGHNDVLSGVLVGSHRLVQPVRELSDLLGSNINPHAAYLMLRGMKTLGVRVEYQNNTAMIIARYLSSMPQIESVYYPGLASHPDFHIAKRQMSGFGAVISFVIKGGFVPASNFIDAVRIPYIAPSLGGVESLIEQPAIISYWDKTPEERASLGIVDGLIRFSCGIEHPDDLLADIAQALKSLDGYYEEEKQKNVIMEEEQINEEKQINEEDEGHIHGQ